MIDTYCWIHGTYTQKPDPMTGKGGASHREFASCNPNPYVNEDTGKEEKKDGYDEDCWHHAYYQFVTMVLVCQAACFYFPW